VRQRHYRKVINLLLDPEVLPTDLVPPLLFLRSNISDSVAVIPCSSYTSTSLPLVPFSHTLALPTLLSPEETITATIDLVRLADMCRVAGVENVTAERI
jgi:hypothetical protein